VVQGHYHQSAEFVHNEAWDGYDYNNLRLSRKFIQDLISDELYERTSLLCNPMKRDQIYIFIVQDMQQIGTVGARIIVDEICKLHIYEIPGKDARSLTNILFEYSWKMFRQFFGFGWHSCSILPKLATLAFNIEVKTINWQAQ